jgi:hypothetical protein
MAKTGVPVKHVWVTYSIGAMQRSGGGISMSDNARKRNPFPVSIGDFGDNAEPEHRFMAKHVLGSQDGGSDAMGLGATENEAIFALLKDEAHDLWERNKDKPRATVSLDVHEEDERSNE